MNDAGPNSVTRRVLTDGTRAAWPVCLGYVPIGVAFGVLGQKAGLSPLEIGLMSVIVFAGSSQFIGVALLSAGAGFLPIVITTFFVNLRHLLMSSALAAHLRSATPRWIALFGYGVTDESFAVNTVRFKSAGWDWQRALVVNHTANLTWVLSTIVGGCAGSFIPRGAFGIDYALVAMLICLLVLQLKGRLDVIVAAAAGVLSVALSLVVPGNGHVVIAAVIAATVGLLFQRKRAARARSEE